jgi:hypothetical protein
MFSIPTTQTNERETGRFAVESADGHRYTLVEHQTFYTFEPVGQGKQTRAGPKHYTLGDGTPVNELPDGRLQVVGSDEIIVRVD